MFKTSTFAYWCCQIAGWGFVWGFLVLNNRVFHPGEVSILMRCGSGLLATHALRTLLRRYLHPAQSLRKEGLWLLLAIICTTALFAALRCVGLYYFTEFHGVLTFHKVLVLTIDSLLLVIPWTLIYWFYRLVVYNKTQALERRRLEWRLREMQIRAGESGVTMEELMDEIGRIMSLIDENPDGARREITAFSRLLREGYLH